MGETDKSGARLEVSVSFGRFEGNNLSWEKWSSFSPNKYLEEVGNLSTPGSVAQKKAYFEAHYKKIAARKAEEELELGTSIVDPVEDSSMDPKLELFNGDGLDEGGAEDVHTTDFSNSNFDNEAKDDNDGCDAGVAEEVPTNCLIEVLSIEERKETPNDEQNVDSELSIKNPNRDEMLEGEATERENGEEEPDSPKEDEFTLSSRVVADKVTQNRKERAVVPAMQMKSTPRQAKAKPISKPISALKSLQKKSNGSALSKGKKFVAGESKRGTAAAASLHMAMNLGHGNSSPITRKSVIMEKLGDKDIVKIAFKPFHNRSNSFSTNTRMQVSSTTHLAHTNGKAGLRKESEKTATQRNNSGSRSKPSPSVSYKGSGPEKKNAAAALSPSLCLRSNERAEKRKEFLKKLEAKSIAREAENAQLNAKSKEEKDSELRKLRQSLNFKAKPLPSFYRGQRKAHLEKVKEAAKSEDHHH